MSDAKHMNRHERLAHDKRRGEILQAIRECYVENGPACLSVSTVTKRAGCTRSLFYHYFPDKQAALDAALDDAVEGFIERLRSWNDRRTFGDIEGALEGISVLLKQLVTEDEGLRPLLAIEGTAPYADLVDRISHRAARYICETTVVDFENHHEVQIDHVYETFYVLITGIIMFLRTHPETPVEQVKDIIASTLHIEGYTEKYRHRKPAR